MANQLEIVDPDYIYVWIKKYETYGEVGLKRKKSNSLIDDKEKIKELEMENEILKKYLQILRLNNMQRRVKRQTTGLVLLLLILQTNPQNPGKR